VQTTAVYIVLAIDLDGQRHVLGHWMGDGAEGANFWLSVVTDLQTRGVEDILIACVDGLTGFKEAIQAVFPRTELQRCLVHQVRSSLSYVSWKDRKAFARDMRTIYQAPTREAAESSLLSVSEKWSSSYPVALRGWEAHWEDLATMFEYGPEIRPDLHHEYDRRVQSAAAQGDEDERLVPERRGGAQAPVPGHA